ncbi:hypothetical protein J1N35_021829, partial [Gossypium stocksii]
EKTLTLYCDDSATIANTNETRNYKRKKHIDHKYRIIMETITDRIVDVVKVTSAVNLMDLFTKTLLAMSFEKHVDSMRMHNTTHLLH